MFSSFFDDFIRTVPRDILLDETNPVISIFYELLLSLEFVCHKKKFHSLKSSLEKTRY